MHFMMAHSHQQAVSECVAAILSEADNINTNASS